ncbi:hypothetical protein V2J09_020467 [Rumex salicifolius]
METNQTQSSAVAFGSDSATQTDTEFETETESGSESQTESAGNSNAYPSPEATYEQVVESAQLFFDKLKAFHSSFFGTEIRFPTLGGKELDLHKLFVEVTSRGGLDKVIREHKWKEVIAAFNFPPTITSASFVVRKHYMSMLYHFEQAYYFRRRGPESTMEAHKSESPITELDSSGTALQFPANPTLQPGISIIGTIDGKCDNGYIVSVNVGSEQMKGILYHIPNTSQASWSADTSVMQNQKRRRRSRLKLRDPAKPKPNRSGYTFFFAEQYAKLRPSYLGQERSISKKIGHLWTRLSEAEKQIIQKKKLNKR